MRENMLKELTLDGIVYLMDDELKKLVRVINKNDSVVKLTAEFCPNLFGASSSFIYAHELKHGEKGSQLYTLDNPGADKKLHMSVDDYAAKGRPKIFYAVTIAQILRIGQDVKRVFDSSTPSIKISRPL